MPFERGDTHRTEHKGAGRGRGGERTDRGGGEEEPAVGEEKRKLVMLILFLQYQTGQSNLPLTHHIVSSCTGF